MRLDRPRIAPLEDADWPEEAAELKERFASSGPGGDRMLNIFRTLGYHPDLLRRWLVFGNHVLMKSTLPPREREILILRIGWRCQAEYEWGQHVAISRELGMTDEDFARIVAGPNADGWDPFEAALVRTVDELHTDAMVSDTTWAALAERYDTRQMLDVLFAVGQYNMVSMVLNSTGVQLDEGIPGFTGP
ncbi:MAG: carboxymuconolactone decarboxylase family protein [Acidobacteriota bacterium]|nr:carboxymuconolactone decarboxylase family protein [Acidobacteriota bacterium]